jgi:anti-sigma B factor antagonist
MTVPLTGEIDMSTADAIDVAAHQALADAVTRLDLDLRAVTFMDSQGLKALLTAQRSLEAEGVGMQLTGTPKCVRRLLETAGVDGIFTVG